MTAPTPESLGALFAEVWDLCDQLAATITDTEVEDKLNELLAMRRPAAPLAPSDPAVDVDLEAMFAAELPPCEVRVWSLRQQRPPQCGRPSVKVVVLVCNPCGPRPKSCCAKHLRQLRRRQRVADLIHVALWACGKCGADMRVGGLS